MGSLSHNPLTALGEAAQCIAAAAGAHAVGWVPHIAGRQHAVRRARAGQPFLLHCPPFPLLHNTSTSGRPAPETRTRPPKQPARSISAYLDGDPQRSVLIASYGDGVGAFDENVVMNGPGWAAAAAAPMAGRL